MKDIPSGNVTFLFTDIEGSTKLAQDHQVTIAGDLKKHNSILHEVFASFNGYIFKIIGDAFCCSFARTTDAVKASVDAMIELNSAEWKSEEIKIRIGIHSGEAEWTGDDYSGYVTLATTQRIMSASHGGQILISDSARNNILDRLPDGIEFRDLGERRLKDLKMPRKLYQIISNDLQSDFPPLKTLDVRPNNLPEQLTNFIGREKEMSSIKDILRGSRLITLLGPGGTGKTRLGLQVGADMIDEFSDGVWFIELASLSDSNLIYSGIASAFNLNESGERKISEVVTDFLRKKEMLLILDNCEHLIGECAVVAHVLLNSCPGIKILASSREAMHITGEMIFHVPALTLPGSEDEISVETLNQYEAVRMFIDRAHSVKSDFTVTNDNAPALAQLCCQLDGIPLAIELAASRIKILTVEKILSNIDNRFKLLTGGSRTALPRQQTLKALIDWSYDLLSEKEKILFIHLSVFSGGWSLEAAEEICMCDAVDRYEILDLLSNLIDKSLVISKEKNGISRYNMLETIRQYSLEILFPDDTIYKRHFEYFLDLSDKDSNNSDDRYSNEWRLKMEIEQDNLRAAIKWSLVNSPSGSADLVKRVIDFWEIRGNYTEAYATLKSILSPEVEISDEARAGLMFNAAFLATYMDENETAENYILQGLDYFKSKGNKKKTAEGLSIKGIVLFVKGETEAATKCSEEGLVLLDGLNDKILEANIRGNLGAFYSGLGKTESALEQLEKAMKICREINYRELLAKLLVSKGGLYYQEGDLKEAGKYYEEVIPILEEVNDQYSLATTLYNLGNLNFAKKNYKEAEEFYDSAMKKSREYGFIGNYDRSYIKMGEIALIKNENEKAKEIFVSSLKSFNKNSEKLKSILSIYGLGNYFFLEKNYKLSAKFMFFAERLNDSIKFRLSKFRQEENVRIINELKNKLDEKELTEIKEEVNDLDIDQAAVTAIAMSEE